MCNRFARSRSVWGVGLRGALKMSNLAPECSARASGDLLGGAPGVAARDIAAPLAQLSSAAHFKRRFAFVAALYFLNPWAVSAFPILTGPILLARGYDLTDTLLYIGLATFGPAVSTFALGPVVDHIERRVSLTLCCLLMLVAVVLFFTVQGSVLLTISVVSFGVGVALCSAVMTMYGAELFPVVSRARATSIASAGNRIASVLVPVVMLPLLHQAGASTVAVVICAVLVRRGGVRCVLGAEGRRGPRGWVSRRSGWPLQRTAATSR